jgi:hypothetical protein
MRIPVYYTCKQCESKYPDNDGDIEKGLCSDCIKSNQGTPFDKITPGIWEAKRAGKDGEYNILIKVYGSFPFFECSVWDYNMTLKGSLANNVSVREIAQFEFGNKIKDIE